MQSFSMCWLVWYHNSSQSATECKQDGRKGFENTMLKSPRSTSVVVFDSSQLRLAERMIHIYHSKKKQEIFSWWLQEVWVLDDLWQFPRSAAVPWVCRQMANDLMPTRPYKHRRHSCHLWGILLLLSIILKFQGKIISLCHKEWQQKGSHWYIGAYDKLGVDLHPP